jgi:hypothetical protein
VEVLELRRPLIRCDRRSHDQTPTWPASRAARKESRSAGGRRPLGSASVSGLSSAFRFSHFHTAAQRILFALATEVPGAGPRNETASPWQGRACEFFPVGSCQACARRSRYAGLRWRRCRP